MSYKALAMSAVMPQTHSVTSQCREEECGSGLTHSPQFHLLHQVAVSQGVIQRLKSP